ncbi:metallophosphoesterase [Clostridia bacterium OttesenSCG-928-F22]|nr:metallophosphoesterase [Clostridia bacterium OttesenSCG-928-F22]
MIFWIVLGSAVFIIALIHIANAIYLRNAWELVEFELCQKRIPSELDGYKIAFVSDPHFKRNGKERRIREVVAAVNMKQPDLLLLGGDFGHDMRRSIALLDRIEAGDGKYCVYGNHDYKRDRTPLTEALQGSDITLLKNEGKYIRQRFYLAGLDDYRYGKPNVDEAVAQASAEDFVLVLSHNPDTMEQLGNQHIDAMLSGHTHGGQITFFNLFAPVCSSRYGNKYRTGCKRYKGKPLLLVSNGIGTSLLPIRMFAKPQVHIITLRHQRGEEYGT